MRNPAVDRRVRALEGLLLIAVMILLALDLFDIMRLNGYLMGGLFIAYALIAWSEEALTKRLRSGEGNG